MSAIILKTLSLSARSQAFISRIPNIASVQHARPRAVGNRMLSTSATRVTEKTDILKLGKLNHVAIATPDLAKATAMYRDILGADVSDAVDLPEHGVTTVFINLGNSKIELLHPFGEKSPIKKFLDKNKDGGIHHICIEVDDIHVAMEGVKGKMRVLDPEPKIGAHGKPVVFLHPKDCGGVLVELEQV